MVRAARQTISIDGKELKLTSLDKVLYPSDGTTKRDVIDYYREIAPVMLPHCRDRPVTRKRWPGGVGADGEGQVFFQKDVGQGAPDWVELRRVQHRDHVNAYPLANDLATLAWFGQLSALELHVPQWRFGDGDEQLPPDRLVLDLDPGDGVGLRECVEVATLARSVLRDMGLECVPVTSGSKGLHLYAPLDGRQSSDEVSSVARELARALEADHPDDIISSMKRAARTGKVFIDWSQNNASKTTIAPYSLRGRVHPTVAAPRTWRELGSPHLRQLDYREVLRRVARRGDPMAGLEPDADDPDSDPAPRDRLTVYRSKRDASRTPEPVPERAGSSSDDTAASFVIQRHEARSLHFDFRLEHDGVLVSWALPKGVPTDPARNRLAVPTEDHPLEYGSFEGEIPAGEYGAGTVEIWDSGTVEIEKWRDDEVVATLTGRKGGGLGGRRTFALFRTNDGSERPRWMIHLMQRDDDAPSPRASRSRANRGSASARPAAGRGRRGPYAPMLATRGDDDGLARLDQDDWAFEMKWDGMRVIAAVDGEAVRLRTRNGVDITAGYPELEQLASAVDATSCVLDGEVVSFNSSGTPDFGLLQRRMHVSGARAIARLRDEVPVSIVLFDVLEINGEPSIALPYEARRELLLDVAPEVDGLVLIPPAFDGDAEAAVASSRSFGLEGIMAKRVGSPYRPGTRSPDWVKFAHVDAAEAVVIGWRESNADPSGFASLLLAMPAPGAAGTRDGEQAALRYAGRVGTGFSAAERRAIRARLERLTRKTPPVDDVPAADRRDAHWATPKLVAEVRYRERTRDGRLRHASWRGLRPDKAVADISPV